MYLRFRLHLVYNCFGQLPPCPLTTLRLCQIPKIPLIVYSVALKIPFPFCLQVKPLLNVARAEEEMKEREEEVRMIQNFFLGVVA